MKVKESNYFHPEVNKAFFSASQIKSFLECQAATMAELEGKYTRDTSTSLMVGSYVDAYFSGEMGDFLSQNPEVFNSRTGELKSTYKQADTIIERIERDPMFMEYLDGEKQKIMVGEIDGFPFKIKMDAYHPHDKIVDLKIMRDLKPVYKDGEFKNFVTAWHYDIQGYVYQSIVEYNTGEKLPFYLAVATKETHPDIAIVEIPQYQLDAVAGLVKHYLPIFDAVKRGDREPERCEKCAWCRDSRVLTKVIDYEELLIERR